MSDNFIFTYICRSKYCIISEMQLTALHTSQTFLILVQNLSILTSICQDWTNYSITSKYINIIKFLILEFTWPIAGRRRQPLGDARRSMGEIYLDNHVAAGCPSLCDGSQCEESKMEALVHSHLFNEYGLDCNLFLYYGLDDYYHR